MQSAETLEGRKELRRGCEWYEPSVAETLRSPEIAISFSLSLSLTSVAVFLGLRCFSGAGQQWCLWIVCLPLLGKTMSFDTWSWTTILFFFIFFAKHDNFILMFSMQVLHLIYHLILSTTFQIVKQNNAVHWNKTSWSVQQYKTTFS